MMSTSCVSSLRLLAALAATSLLIAGCGSSSAGPEPVAEAAEPPAEIVPPDEGPPLFPDLPPCDPSITVQPDSPALLVNNPEALKGFTLERVLKQILQRDGTSQMSAEELLQRLFDTENSEATGVFPGVSHCDSPTNGAFKNAPAVDCPRAEGALAKSKGMFTPGDPDYFLPVAVVNRLDLAPKSMATCGEYRVIFAKQSGLTDPNQRVFLIFEGALENPSFSLNECRKVQTFWKDLEDVRDDPAQLAERLEELYFIGTLGFGPVIDGKNLGILTDDDSAYGQQRGQVRVSQRMQEPWELREFRYKFAGPGGGAPPFYFAPSTVKNSPMPALFDPASILPQVEAFRAELLSMNLQSLATKGVAHVGMRVGNMFNMGESALSGPASAGYLDALKGDGALEAQIEQNLASWGLDKGCPQDDPLTGESIIRRAATQSCAGCHAPEKFLGADRKIGCGLAWPSANGEVHINEKGELSPALRDVFLPRRASVVATFLQSCDLSAIYANLQDDGGNGIPK